MSQEEYISKLARVVNENLDSKIKKQLGAFAPPKPAPEIKLPDFDSKLSSVELKFRDMVAEFQSILDEAKSELDDIKRIKALLLSDIIERSSSASPLLSASKLLENVEKQREEFLNRMKEREAKWDMEEERIKQERIIYEKEMEKLKK